MRTTYVLALVASLSALIGCATNNGTQGNGFWGSGFDSGRGGSGWSAPSFGLRKDTGCGGGGGCSTGDCGGCSTGDCGGSCGTEQSFSDQGFDCGPMCGAYLNENHFSDSTSCENCGPGPSYVKNQVSSWNRWFGKQQAASPGLGFARPCRGAGCGACEDCASAGPVRSAFNNMGNGGLAKLATCKGLGRAIGCLGCGDCGGGNAIGLNQSTAAGPISSHLAGGGVGASGGQDACSCVGCRSGGRLGACRRGGASIHPYGGEIPHTASAGGQPGGPGMGAPGTAPAYSYPYYTTRGPRDFLMKNPPSIGR